MKKLLYLLLLTSLASDTLSEPKKSKSKKSSKKLGKKRKIGKKFSHKAAKTGSSSMAPTSSVMNSSIPITPSINHSDNSLEDIEKDLFETKKVTILNQYTTSLEKLKDKIVTEKNINLINKINPPSQENNKPSQMQEALNNVKELNPISSETFEMIKEMSDSNNEELKGFVENNNLKTDEYKNLIALWKALIAYQNLINKKLLIEKIDTIDNKKLIFNLPEAERLFTYSLLKKIKNSEYLTNRDLATINQYLSSIVDPMKSKRFTELKEKNSLTNLFNNILEYDKYSKDSLEKKEIIKKTKEEKKIKHQENKKIEQETLKNNKQALIEKIDTIDNKKLIFNLPEAERAFTYTLLKKIKKSEHLTNLDLEIIEHHLTDISDSTQLTAFSKLTTEEKNTLTNLFKNIIAYDKYLKDSLHKKEIIKNSKEEKKMELQENKKIEQENYTVDQIDKLKKNWKDITKENTPIDTKFNKIEEIYRKKLSEQMQLIIFDKSTRKQYRKYDEDRRKKVNFFEHPNLIHL